MVLDVHILDIYLNTLLAYGGLNTCIVSHTAFQYSTPVNYCCQVWPTLKSFDKSITLCGSWYGVVYIVCMCWCLHTSFSSCDSNCHLLMKLLCSKTHTLHLLVIHHSGTLLVRDRDVFHPMWEVVTNSHDVTISLVTLRQWPAKLMAIISVG